jgi:hypothetical protein
MLGIRWLSHNSRSIEKRNDRSTVKLQKVQNHKKELNIQRRGNIIIKEKIIKMHQDKDNLEDRLITIIILTQTLLL